MSLKTLFKFGSGRGEHCGSFKDMSKSEKKTFLSNDFIERMIRVEQRVSLSFGQYIPYRKTKYYQSLTNCERDKFESYLKHKSKPRKYMLVVIFLALIGFAVIKFEMTGNAINDSLGNGASSALSNFFVIFILASFLFIGIIFVLKKRKEKQFNSKFEVIDKIVSSRRVR